MLNLFRWLLFHFLLFYHLLACLLRRCQLCLQKRMWEWIRTSRGLKAKLEAAGWVKFQKLYTPKQVAVLMEHLGEP